MRRATTFGGMLVYLLAAFVSGLFVLGVGYWVSDLAYAANLWPIGAIIRVSLLLFLIGWTVGIIAFAVATLASPFVKPDF